MVAVGARLIRGEIHPVHAGVRSSAVKAIRQGIDIGDKTRRDADMASQAPPASVILPGSRITVGRAGGRNSPTPSVMPMIPISVAWPPKGIRSSRLTTRPRRTWL